MACATCLQDLLQKLLPSGQYGVTQAQQIDPWDRVENLEIDPAIYKHIIFTKVTKSM